MPAPGDILPLRLLLNDGNASKYVRAIVTNDAGLAISGSPFALLSVGSGVYKSNVATMPSGVQFVQALYEVFDDPGFTIPSTIYGSALDVFESVTADLEALEQITEDLEKVSQQLKDEAVRITTNDLFVTIEDESGTTAIIEES